MIILIFHETIYQGGPITLFALIFNRSIIVVSVVPVAYFSDVQLGSARDFDFFTFIASVLLPVRPHLYIAR